MKQPARCLTCILAASLPLLAQGPPKVEIFGGYAFATLDNKFSITGDRATLPGWAANATAILSKHWGMTADFSGYYWSQNRNITVPASPGPTAANLAANHHTYSYVFGPNLAFPSQRRITPSLHSLFGVTNTGTDISVRAGGTTSTSRQTANEFTIVSGAVMDVRVTRHVSIRAAEVDYLMLRHQNSFTNNFMFRTGFVLIY